MSAIAIRNSSNSNEFIKRGALVQRRGAFGFVADGDAADRFLAQVIPNLQGWDVRGRDALHRGRPPKDIVIHTKVNADKENLTLGISAEVEGREVSIKDLLASAARGQNVMMFKDGMRARINDEWLARYRTLVEFGGVEKASTKVKVKRHAAALAVGLAESGGTMELDAATVDLAQLAKGGATIPSVDLPKGINATLREYQQEGFNWMVFLSDRGLGGVLADDMGLGKTLQSLSFPAPPPARRSGRAIGGRTVFVWCDVCVCVCVCVCLCVCVPDVPVYTHLGLDRTKKLDDLPKGGILLTSYNILQRDIKLLKQIEFSTVILDEAHIIRNPEAKTTRAALPWSSSRAAACASPVRRCRTAPKTCGRSSTSSCPSSSAAARCSRKPCRRTIKPSSACAPAGGALRPASDQEGGGHRAAAEDRNSAPRPHERRAVRLLPRSLLEKERVGVMDLLGSRVWSAPASPSLRPSPACARPPVTRPWSAATTCLRQNRSLPRPGR